VTQASPIQTLLLKGGFVRIRRYQGDRGTLLPLFQDADDSELQVSTYLNLGEVFVAQEEEEFVGHLQLIADGEIFELKSMAVVADRRRRGIGAALIGSAIAYCSQQSACRILVSTAAADTDNLRFYQRQGFRMLSVERDAFSLSRGYREGILISGIPLRDRVWLDLDLLTRT
jgi:GNAT superfamily N-acetyltransferase